MGGAAKGLLPVDDVGSETIAARLVRIVRAAGHEPVLVAGVARAEPYATLGLPLVVDARDEAGPLGGLVALLASVPGEDVVVLACDLPRVAPSVIGKLTSADGSQTLAPWIDDRWQPLVARYSAEALTVATEQLRAGALSLQRLLPLVHARKLALDDAEAASLVDWDCAEDVGG